MSKDGEPPIGRDRGSPPRAPARRFGAGDRLADVVAADPGAADRFVALHPCFGFLKLADPAERLSEALSLAEAARLSGLPLARVLAIADGEAPTARDAAERPPCGPVTETEPEPRPEWMDGFVERAAPAVDARALLAAGEDPLSAVLAAAAGTAEGGGLIIDAPFNPLPLRQLLARQGFSTHGRSLAPGHWRIWCRRSAPTPAAATKPAGPSGPMIWRAADGVHIDVRGLEAPGPLTSILALIESGDHDGVVVVHHWRQPLYLFPELAERHWSWEEVPAAEPGELRFVLRRSDR